MFIAKSRVVRARGFVGSSVGLKAGVSVATNPIFVGSININVGEGDGAIFGVKFRIVINGMIYSIIELSFEKTLNRKRYSPFVMELVSQANKKSETTLFVDSEIGNHVSTGPTAFEKASSEYAKSITLVVPIMSTIPDTIFPSTGEVMITPLSDCII